MKWGKGLFGKYTKTSKNNPQAVGLCDYSGALCRRVDMVKQKQYAGQGLIDTGLLINPKYADVPNPQSMTPLFKLDPVPIVNARPDPQTFDQNQSNYLVDVTGLTNFTIPTYQLNPLSNSNIFNQNWLAAQILTLSGNPNINCYVYIPPIVKEFTCINLVNNGANIYLSLENGENLLIPTGNCLVNFNGKNINIVSF